MKTILLSTLLLAAAIPTGAQELMTYSRLCGVTEGTGDNNDFCTLWAQNNWQGMRNALSVAIRTARAVENRNRYYFDHKRGADRSTFIQVKRNWMDDDWQVRRYERFISSRGLSRVDRIVYFEITNAGEDAWLFLDLQEKRPSRYSFDGISEFGHERVALYGVSENKRLIDERWTESEAGGLPSDYVRRVVECKIDEYGWHLGEVEVRPDCEGIEE